MHFSKGWLSSVWHGSHVVFTDLFPHEKKTHDHFLVQDQSAIVIYDNNLMAHFALGNLDVMKDGFESNENNFTLLPTGFHGDVINGMDICVQKTLVATVSADRAIRIWNYRQYSVELYREFTEEIISISLHPSGLLVLLGFRYRLALYSILADDLYECGKWAVKSCSLVKFSNGGHKFAAVSANSVIVFSTNTHEVVHILRGHSTLITSLIWSDDDSYIVTCGNEGAVFEWYLDVSDIAPHVILSFRLFLPC